MFRRFIGATALALIALATAAGQVVNVSPIGNPTVSGRKLLRAVERISAPSATNPWLVKIEPGVYDLGNEALVMRPFVDIEGSGQGVTTITGSGIFVLITASDADVRELTLQSTGTHPPGAGCPNLPSLDCYAIYADTGVTAKITDVTIHTTSGAFPLGLNIGSTVAVNAGSITCADFCHGVHVNDGTATLQGTSITALSTLSRGIDNGGTVNLINSTVDVGDNGSTVALQTLGGVTNVQHSIVRGRHVQISAQTNIGTSQVELFGTTTGAKCVASYDASFSALGADCQPLP